jgi:hypothetical protein
LTGSVGHDAPVARGDSHLLPKKRNFFSAFFCFHIEAKGI